MAENESVTTGWERTNNPLGREPWQFIAKLGINQELSRCLWDYDEAVEALFETVAIGKQVTGLDSAPSALPYAPCP